MNLVEVYSKRGKRRHLVDADRYTRVSRSRSLCGKTGKDYWIPNMVYFYGVHWQMCKECERLSKPNNKRSKAPNRKVVCGE